MRKIYPQGDGGSRTGEQGAVGAWGRGMLPGWEGLQRLNSKGQI